MQKPGRTILPLAAAGLCALAMTGLVSLRTLARASAADDAASPTPVADLVAEAESIIQANDAMLADETEYKKASKAVAKDAVILAVLSHQIGTSDDESPWKATAMQIRDQAVTLAKASSYDEARAAHEAIKKLLDGQAAGPAADKKLEDVTELHPLMEEVSSRNTRLRRSLLRSRFERTKDEAARSANVLAALAVAARGEHDYVENDDDRAKWEGFADGLHEGMTSLAGAFREGDYSKARSTYVATMRVCNDCHKQFRPDIEM